MAKKTNTHKITDHHATMLVALVRVSRPQFADLTPEAKNSMESGGYRVKPSKTGLVSVSRGSATIPPSDCIGYLSGLCSGTDNAVAGWKIPHATDAAGNPIPLTRLLDQRMGLQVRFSK